MLMNVRQKLVLISFIFFSITIIGQEKSEEELISFEDAKVLIDNEEHYKEWLLAIETPGVKATDSTMTFSNEAQRLINDQNYRASVYKSNYSFEDVATSLKTLEIQKAFWQMINLYPENKELVVQYIYAYDNVIPADKVVSASFSTYAFFDPEITEIVNGKPNVLRPDIFEEHLKNANEIIYYINYYRNQAKKATN